MLKSMRFSRVTLMVWLFMAFMLVSADLAAAANGTVEEFNKGKEGQEIDKASLPAQGIITVVDFSSEFCPPCRRMGILLEDLVKKRTDLVVRKLNVNRPGVIGIDWRSPLVQEFGLKGLPHFMIYGKDGKLMAEGESAFNMVLDWCKQAGVLKE